MTVTHTYNDRTHYRNHIEQQFIKNQIQLDTINHEGSQVKKDFQINLHKHPISDPDVKIFYFDIDNTLYSRSTGIQELMQSSIYDYVTNELSVPSNVTREIMVSYYKRYGLMVSGLVKNFDIDPLKYNSMVDDSLNINDILKPDLKLRKLLIDLKEAHKIDKFWLCTNAYIHHALRCIRLLGVADLFDGITYTDYHTVTNGQILCKPDPRFFERTILESGLGSWKNAYFVDDSLANIETASSLGMNTCFYLAERDNEGNLIDDTEAIEPDLFKNVITIDNIYDIRKTVPDLFESNA